MKPKVKKDDCIGCGLCTSICPEVFSMDGDGKAEVKEGVSYEVSAQKIKESIEVCPTKAIISD